MPRDLPKTKEEAMAQISNEIYAASGLYESLEHDGHVAGNGHHIRQQLAAYAAELMGQRWSDEDIRSWRRKDVIS